VNGRHPASSSHTSTVQVSAALSVPELTSLVLPSPAHALSGHLDLRAWRLPPATWQSAPQHPQVNAGLAARGLRTRAMHRLRLLMECCGWQNARSTCDPSTLNIKRQMVQAGQESANSRAAVGNRHCYGMTAPLERRLAQLQHLGSASKLFSTSTTVPDCATSGDWFLTINR
jgi:hypothetical protein